MIDRPRGTKAVDAALLLARATVPEPMRPGLSGRAADAGVSAAAPPLRHRHRGCAGMKGATTATRNANPIPRASVRLDFQRRLRTPRVMMPAASNTSARRQAHGSSHGVPPNSYSFETTRGGAATIRPPASYINGVKRQQIAAYGYPDTDPRGYERIT